MNEIFNLFRTRQNNETLSSSVEIMAMVQSKSWLFIILIFLLLTISNQPSYIKSSNYEKGRELKLCEMNENHFLECFNTRKREMLLNNCY